MCDRDSTPFAAPLLPDPLATQRPSGSRRRRLWDLSRKCHCPVIGVCLPLATLRRLAGKVLGEQIGADDYDVHVGAVAECAARGPLSEAVQRELERRYAQSILRFKAAKSAEAVWEIWTEAVNRGDVAGPLWAALTHPRCDAVLEEGLCRDMHMIQHQAGAAVRVELDRFEALQRQNAFLAGELDKVQQAQARLTADRVAEVERLTAELMQSRTESIARDASCVMLQNELAGLRASIPDLDARTRLQGRIEQMSSRQRELEMEVRSLRQQLAVLGKEPETPAASGPGADHAAACAPAPAPARAVPVTLHLHDRTILCVGGRTGNVATYRHLVEQAGSQFAYHDGGLEDNQGKLDANLAAADLVICQTGCISHNAYWRVKDFCKRHGKRCIFVENPSASSFARNLEQALTGTEAGNAPV